MTKQKTFLVAAILVAATVSAHADDKFTLTLGGGSLTKTRSRTGDGLTAGLQSTAPVGVAGLTYKISDKFSFSGETFLTDRRDSVAFSNADDHYGVGQKVPGRSFGYRLGTGYNLRSNLKLNLSFVSFQDQLKMGGSIDPRSHMFSKTDVSHRYAGGEVGLVYQHRVKGNLSVSTGAGFNLLHTNATYHREDRFVDNAGNFSNGDYGVASKDSYGSWGYSAQAMLHYKVGHNFVVGAGYQYMNTQSPRDVVSFNVEVVSQAMRDNTVRNNSRKGVVFQISHSF